MKFFSRVGKRKSIRNLSTFVRVRRHTVTWDSDAHKSKCYDPNLWTKIKGPL